jgi:DNA-binding NtrC family response regulator
MLELRAPPGRAVLQYACAHTCSLDRRLDRNRDGIPVRAALVRGLQASEQMGFMVPAKKVLIVDDEERQRRSLSIALRLDGFEVESAGNAADALRILADGACEFALVDLMMPGVNGLELARQVQRLFPSVKVVLTSAYHLSERQLLRADCGAIGFVPKPYRTADLVDFLRNKTQPSA